MPDFNAIGQLISSYGFPIVACAFLAWYTYTRDEKFTEQLKEFTKVQNAMVTAIQRLYDRLDIKMDEVER